MLLILLPGENHNFLQVTENFHYPRLNGLLTTGVKLTFLILVLKVCPLFLQL